MKIKLLGINFKLGSGISLSDLFKYIAKTEASPIEVGNYGRFLYIGERDDCHVGLLITTKNHKKFLEFKQDKVNAKLEARDVSEGAKFAEFNFFAIHKRTGRGIYQYYHHSCSLNTFGIICRQYYEKLKIEKIAEALEQCAEITPKNEKAIKKRFAGKLDWEIVVRPEAFDTLIERLKSIKAVTLSLSTLAYERTAFTPLSRVAKNMTQRYSFAAKSSVATLIDGIRSVIQNSSVDGAKVEGVDCDGLDQVIKLVNTPDFFGEFDFDGVAGTMTISPQNFIDSQFLKEIIKVTKSAPALNA